MSTRRLICLSIALAMGGVSSISACLPSLSTETHGASDAGPTAEAAASEAGMRADASVGADAAIVDSGADAVESAVVDASRGDGALLSSNGVACDAGSQCSSSFCVDGVCCNGACAGSCEACNMQNLLGTCSAVPAGDAPASTHTSCATMEAGTCQEDGKCDGDGGCALWPNGTVCGSGTCNAGTNEAITGYTCNGQGNCVAAPSTSCAPFMCASGGTACATTCSTDAQCVGQPCVGSSCGTVSNGSPCTSGSQCTSTYCVDGYCCNVACGGSCQACDVAAAQGTCTTVTSGQPHGTRVACAGSGTCQGSCNGSTTECAYPTALCAAETCANGIESLPSSCNGAGACGTQSTASCNGYACNGTGCFTSCATSAQCAAPTPYCNGTTCLATAPLGQACSTNSQCTSDNCVEGVCCGGTVTGSWYPDCDGDGHGRIGSTAVVSCSPPSTAPTCDAGAAGGWAASADDCCDIDSRAHPGQSPPSTPGAYPGLDSGLPQAPDNCGGFDYGCGGTPTELYPNLCQAPVDAGSPLADDSFPSPFGDFTCSSSGTLTQTTQCYACSDVTDVLPTTCATYSAGGTGSTVGYESQPGCGQCTNLSSMEGIVTFNICTIIAMRAVAPANTSLCQLCF